MKDNSKDFEPLTMVWTLVGAVSDAMNLRNLREELYGESARLLPPATDDRIPVSACDRPQVPADRSIRVARFGAKVP